MPDLMEVTMYHCLSAERWQMQVSSRSRKFVTHTVTFGALPYEDGSYEYGYTCSCEKFTFTGACHHIDQVKHQRCGWQQFMDGGLPVLGGTPEAGTDGDRRCPQCGGPVGVARHGV